MYISLDTETAKFMPTKMKEVLEDLAYTHSHKIKWSEYALDGKS